MSYSKFLDDLNTFYKNNANKDIDYEVAWAIIRDEWIAKGEIEGLIIFILENWDLGNCDDFIPPLEKHLIDTLNLKAFKKLWIGIIKTRLNRLREKFTQEQKNSLLTGILKFKQGLMHFEDQDEINKLDKLVLSLKSSNRVKYPV